MITHHSLQVAANNLRGERFKKRKFSLYSCGPLRLYNTYNTYKKKFTIFLYFYWIFRFVVISENEIFRAVRSAFLSKSGGTERCQINGNRQNESEYFCPIAYTQRLWKYQQQKKKLINVLCKEYFIIPMTNLTYIEKNKNLLHTAILKIFKKNTNVKTMTIWDCLVQKRQRYRIIM